MLFRSSKIQNFKNERDRLNKVLSEYAGKTMKEFMGLDYRCYQTGALTEKTKELMGLVASLVLRCDDCINYHLMQCLEKNVSDEELVDTLTIGLIVGGSITIPHIRRAFDIWDEAKTASFKADRKAGFSKVAGMVKGILAKEQNPGRALEAVCLLLKNNVPHYDWVGYYITDPNKPNELVLGPYAGEPTEHTRISFEQGICGQAAEKKASFIIQDVSKETNYLSCSFRVKSEIVVPIMDGDKVIGELDIDSHTISPFSEEDEAFLEEVVGLTKIYVKQIL